MTGPDRAAHRTYEARHKEIEAETRGRLKELANALGLDGDVRSRFMTAGLRVARFHAADSALAEHELRSGHSWPAEDKQARDELQASQWETVVDALREAVAEAAGREDVVAEEEPGGERPRRFEVRYQPISTISRPQE